MNQLDKTIEAQRVVAASRPAPPGPPKRPVRYTEHHSQDWIDAIGEGWYTKELHVLSNGIRIAEMRRTH